MKAIAGQSFGGAFGQAPRGDFLPLPAAVNSSTYASKDGVGIDGLLDSCLSKID